MKLIKTGFLFSSYQWIITILTLTIGFSAPVRMAWGGRLLFIVLLAGGLTINSYSQRVGVNTTGALPNASALLDVDAAPTNDKGILIPRVSLTNVNTYAPITGAPVTSLLVYNNNAAMTGGTIGYWYWDGAQWVQLGAGGGGGNAWLILGNAGTVDGTNFLGTTDNVPMNFKVNGQKAGRIDQAGPTFFGYQAGNSNVATLNSTGIGYQALYSNTSANANTAIGYQALYSNVNGSNNTATGLGALYTNTGHYNTATGEAALYSNTTGDQNTATGLQALYSNTTGYSNVAIGVNSLYHNTTRNNLVAIGDSALYNNGVGAVSAIHGTTNTAVGSKALYSNTTGSRNTATGWNALYSSTTGTWNTAHGGRALYANTSGFENTATGVDALSSNTTGSSNTATGMRALYLNDGGILNTAVGAEALYSNTNGTNNTAVGGNCLFSNITGGRNTVIGRQSLFYNVTGTNNTAVGYQSGYGTAAVDFDECTFVGSTSFPTVARTNVTMLGYGIANAQCTGNNQVCVGNTAIGAGGLRAAVAGWTAYSDARFKTNIKENVAGLDFILKLKPVTYNVRPKELHKIWGTPDSLISAIDFSEAEQESRIGFLAQDVEKAAKESGFDFPGIDVPRNEKEVYALRYVDFIMPLTQGMQEQQKMIEKLQLENTNLKTENTAILNEMKDLKFEYNNRLKKLEEILGPPATLAAPEHSVKARVSTKRGEKAEK